MKNVLLVGLGPTALTALQSLVDQFRLIGVMRNLAPGAHDEVAEYAKAVNVPVLSDVSLAGLAHAISRGAPDCVVLSSYNRIVPPEMLRRGRFVNVHYAPLPRYRGRANVNWAIINGEDEIGITIHTVVPDLDAGKILFQEAIPLGSDDTISDAYRALNEVQKEMLGTTVARYLVGYEGEPQDERYASYCCSRVEADGEIAWSESSAKVYALVRALGAAYPPAYTYLGIRRLSVLRARPMRDAPVYVGRIPGRVVNRAPASGHVDVLTGDGIIRLYEVAAEGAGAVPASEIITSTRETLGLRTSDLVARIAALQARLERREDSCSRVPGDQDGTGGESRSRE